MFAHKFQCILRFYNCKRRERALVRCYWKAIVINIRKWLQLVADWSVIFCYSNSSPDVSLSPSLCMGVCAYDLHIYKIIFRMKNWSCNYVEITFEFWAQNRCQHYYYSKINQINETIKLDDYYLIWSSSLFTCYTTHFHLPSQSNHAFSSTSFTTLSINHKLIAAT